MGRNSSLHLLDLRELQRHLGRWGRYGATCGVAVLALVGCPGRVKVSEFASPQKFRLLLSLCPAAEGLLLIRAEPPVAKQRSKTFELCCSFPVRHGKAGATSSKPAYITSSRPFKRSRGRNHSLASTSEVGALSWGYLLLALLPDTLPSLLPFNLGC